MVAPAQAVVSAGPATPAGSPPTQTVTLGSTSTTGNTLFVFVYNDSNVAVTGVTDDATPSNTYVLAESISGATSYGPTNAVLYVSTTFRAAKNLKATWGGGTAPSNSTIFGAEYPGNWTFISGSTGSNAAEPPSPATGNFTNSESGDLLLGPIAGFYNPGTGYTSRLYSGPGLWQDKTASTASTTNTATGTPGNSGWLIIGAAFKSSAGAPPPNPIFFNTD